MTPRTRLYASNYKDLAEFNFASGLARRKGVVGSSARTGLRGMRKAKRFGNRQLGRVKNTKLYQNGKKRFDNFAKSNRYQSVKRKFDNFRTNRIKN